MKKPWFIFAAAIVGLAVYFGSPTTATIRYRLTLNFAVDGAPVSGSGVIETTYTKVPDFYLDESKMHVTFRGAAVVVDLGSHGKLFALLKQPMKPSDAQYNYIIPRIWGRNPGTASDVRWIRGMEGKKDMPRESVPLLVRFSDTNDPKTIQIVQLNNLAASLGPGVEFTGATVEITQDAITKGIVDQLPWLGGLLSRHAWYFETIDLQGHGVLAPGSKENGILFATGDFVQGE